MIRIQPIGRGLSSFSLLIAFWALMFAVESTDIAYWLFVLLGFAGGLLALFKQPIGRLMLAIFFLLQSVFIHVEGFTLDLNPGLRIPIKAFQGSVDNPELPLIGVNLLALGVLIALAWPRKEAGVKEDNQISGEGA